IQFATIGIFKMAFNEFFEDLDKDFIGDPEHAFIVQEKVNDIKRELKSESKMDIEKGKAIIK
ncbi:15014_t:CDS:1, partial [Gigaspora margarita]